MRYECQDIFSHEVIAAFDTYDEADNFLDAAYDMPDWWTIPAMAIVEMADDEQHAWVHDKKSPLRRQP